MLKYTAMNQSRTLDYDLEAIIVSTGRTVSEVRYSQSSTPDKTRLAALLTILMHVRYTATSQVESCSGFQLEANAAAISRYKSSLNVGNFLVICRFTTDK